jgi:antitoxin component YwqK of YwqJK toxin-antitoxin module
MFTAMKRVIFILSFGVVACSGKVTITEAEIQPDIFYARGAYKPFSGTCIIVFSKTDLIKDQFTYKNGMLNGEAITYDKNGQLRRKGYYLDGKLSGKWEFWDDKGNKTMEATYQNDVLNGSCKRFDNLK